MYTRIKAAGFMGQWFLFVRQLLQMLLNLCPVLFCSALRYSSIQKQFGFQVGSLETQVLQLAFSRWYLFLFCSDLTNLLFCFRFF